MTQAGERSGRVQSVDRAAALLRAVARAAPHGATVAVLSAECGLNRATAWRLLATLEDNGLVEREPGSSRYVLGLEVTRLATAVGVEGIVRRAHPLLERLSERTGETADLAVVRPTGLTYVDEISPPSVMTANWLGRSVPLHATSSGKTWLAWLAEPEARSLLPGPLERFTATTLTSVEELGWEFERIRSRGFGTCSGEFEERLYGVSAPVLVDGRPVAVVSIWGPSDRLPASRFPELGPLAMAAAGELAEALTTRGVA